MFSSSMSEKCRFSVVTGRREMGGTGESGEQEESGETADTPPPQLGDYNTVTRCGMTV